MTSTYHKSLASSLCLHLVLVLCLFLFSRPSDYEELLVVDLALVGISGSGQGNTGNAQGTPGPSEAGAAAPAKAGAAAPHEAEKANDTPDQNAIPDHKEESKKSDQPELLPPEKPAEPAVENKEAPAPEKIPHKPKPVQAPEKAVTKAKPDRTAQPATQKKQAAKSRSIPGQGHSRPSSAQAEGTGAPSGSPGKGSGDNPGAGGGDKGGSGGGAGKAYADANYSYILQHIRKNLFYPPQARRMNMTGRARYSFTIQRNGSVTNITIVQSSGFTLLDDAGVKAIKAASPLPPPPVPARIVIPIDFTLK